MTYGPTLGSILTVEGDLILNIRVAYDARVVSNAGDVTVDVAGEAAMVMMLYTTV